MLYGLLQEKASPTGVQTGTSIQEGVMSSVVINRAVRLCLRKQFGVLGVAFRLAVDSSVHYLLLFSSHLQYIADFKSSFKMQSEYKTFINNMN